MRAGGANIGDQSFVARTIEDGHHQVLSVDIHCAAAGWAYYDFFHVQVGGVEEVVFFAGGQDGDRIRGAQRAQIGAFQGIDGNIDGG